MRTRAVLGSIFASTAVLVVGWQAGGAVLANQAALIAPTAPAANAAAATVGNSTAPAPAAATPAASGPADGTFTGASVPTVYGNVQVAVTISGGSITAVTALHLTDDGGVSVQKSNHAAPILQKEVLASQSAKVSNVGGCTYTSDAYLTSVQSALDQAKM